jgi:ribosomal protein L40E
MRKWLIFVLFVGLLVFPSTAGAQGGTKLKSINIELWSEYDQPSMLVIHEFTVDESTALPVQVKLRFPKDGNLVAVAYLEDSFINADFTGPEEQGLWQTVTLNVQSYAPHRIEYYQPLTRDGNQRQFSFRWFGDYPVDEFNITVQVPSDSSNILAEPVFSDTVKSADGLHIVGMVTRNGLRMGQSYEFKIQYERETELVTRPGEGSNIQPSEPVGPNTEGRVSIDNLPYIIGGFGLSLIGLALFFYWRSTQTSERKSRRRRRSANDEEDSEEQAYCHECGARAHPGDRFCRTCGSRLKV